MESFGVSSFHQTKSQIIFNANIDSKIRNSINRRSSFISDINGNYTNYYFLTKKRYKNNPNLYLTHWFYYYRGKFYPRMIRSLINIIGLKEGDVLMDPFMGSGTSALEAQLLGVNYIGVDISPLCKIIADSKTNSVFYVNEIDKIKLYIFKNIKERKVLMKNDFYEFLNDITEEATIRNFITIARLNAVKYALNSDNFISLFFFFLNNMTNYLCYYKSVCEKTGIKLGTVKLLNEDTINHLNFDNIIDGIITSPPYYNALDYAENESISLSDLSIDSKTISNKTIGLKEKKNKQLECYNKDLFKCYSNIFRYLKKGKYAVLIVGNNYNNGCHINNIKYNIEQMLKSGFTLIMNIPTDKYNKNKSVLRESILIFQK